jgi:hypothetical protein
MVTETVDEPVEEEEEKKKRKGIVSYLQVGGLILLLFALMTTSVVTALMATGIIDISTSTNGPANSMTDAQFICNNALQKEHGDRLQAFSMDDLSSREDKARGGYKLYYELEMYRDASKQTGVTHFYVNCFVAANGRIRRMDLMEEKIFVPKPVKRTHGNAFGL